MKRDASTSSCVLVGNSFPLSLVRRRVTIEPASVEDLRAAIAGKTVCSYWGHASTLPAVNRHTGLDLTPVTERPALLTDPVTRLPTLNGRSFSECWVISPEYESGFRPAAGAVVPPQKITTWQVLRIRWGTTQS